MEYRFSNKILSLKPSGVGDILKSTKAPGMIPFAAGNPAPDAFPVSDVVEISDDILRNRPFDALQYGVAEGYRPLIDAILKRMKEKYNVGTYDDSVVVTSGAQQVMDLASKVFVNEGDVVISENPSFIGALDCFKSYGANLVGVPIDADGMNMDALEKALCEHENAKLIYTIPNFQNPAGVTMSLEKRKKLYELALKHNVIIIEDNPYGNLRASGEDIPSIKSFDDKGIVIYSGSFSKILAPGIRVGYAIASSEIISKMVFLKQVDDVHTAQFMQMLVAEWLLTCDIDAHIEKIQAIYRKKLNLMCDMIDKEMGDDVKYVRPEGGLFVSLTLPDEVDMLDYVKECSKNKVALVPGTVFSTNPEEKCNFVRLNFSTPTDEKIVEGVKIIAKVLKDMRNRKG